ncbi:MAG: hypothetical protein KC419_22720, partial [Anaerolineales bacterium]|nr:hypothetical protein [Anaerolineales bacterium]
MMNNHIKRLLLSLFVGVSMIWALLNLFTLSPAAAQEVHCDEGSFFEKFLPQCRTEDDKAPSFSVPAWLENIGAAEEITPEQALAEAYQHAIDAESYEFSAISEQTLIPRARPDMIGQTQQQVDMHVSGEVTLPDYSLLSVSLDGPGLDPTPVAIVQEGLKSYLLREGEKVPVENPAGLTSPTGDYLSYLAAAVNVQPCELVAAPFETAVSCYTYDIDGPVYADHVQTQLEAQMARTPGAAPLGIEVSTPALLKQISGQGKIWLDENNLPLRQKVDMLMPEADDYYDADVRMVIDYTFDETAVAAVQAAIAADASFLPTPAEVVESAAASLPTILVFVLFLTIAVLLIALRRRRWMYSFFAVSITVIMLGTPILQIVNAELFLARRAYAAGAKETLVDTFVADEESVAERPSSTTASQTLMAQAMSPLTQAYQPDTYCGSGGNGDRD